MPQVVDDVASLVEQLTRRIAELEARVSALEHPSPASPSQYGTTAFQSYQSAPALVPVNSGTSGNVIAVLGKAVLAMAGAYLLRAIAESTSGAEFPMLLAAIVYACGWMAWAVRAHRTNHFASAAYGTTATLILAPLLYESTTKFQLLSIASTSAVLAAFAVLVLVLAWHSNLQVLPWVGTIASISTLWVLLVSTHALVPLTCALLAIAVATEIAACLGHRLSLWAMVAIAADAAIALFIYVMTSTDGVPTSYPPATPTTTALLSLSLLGIYGGGIAIRSFGERKQISNFEVLQGALVFALAYLGATRASQGAAPILGAMFLALSLVCYWGALSRFSDVQQTRNRVIAACWAVVLMLIGFAVLFPPSAGAVVFCVLGIGALLLYPQNADLGFALHASLYLAAAAVWSPFFSYAREALAGAVPGLPHWTVWIVLASTLSCYSIARHSAGERRRRRMLWIIPAALTSVGFAALGVVALHALVSARFALTASVTAGIRTIVTCLVALGLGFLASRFKRPELGWLAYVAVGLGALKLLVEDFRIGNAVSLVISLLFYGLILILLPRLLRPAIRNSM
jgi:hypothetical protein